MSYVSCVDSLSCSCEQVQADRCISTEELKLQMGQVAEQLETVEQKGVELEREIRVCTNSKAAVVCFLPFLTEAMVTSSHCPQKSLNSSPNRISL